MRALWREGTEYSALPCWEKVLVAESGGRVRVSGHGVTRTDLEVELRLADKCLVSFPFPESTSPNLHMTSCPPRQDYTGRQGPGNTNPDMDKLRVRHNERSSLNRTVSGNGVMRAHQTQP